MNYYRRKDLSNVDRTTATKIIKDSMERFNSCKTKEDIIKLCHELFDAASLDTPWTRKFFYNIEQKHGYTDAMLYVGQCYLAGCGMAMN